MASSPSLLMLAGILMCMQTCHAQTCAADDASCDQHVFQAGCGSIEPKDLFGPLSNFSTAFWRKRPILIKRNCSNTFKSLQINDLVRMFPDVLSDGEQHGNVQVSSMRKGDEYVRIINFYANIFLAYLDGASVTFNQFDMIWPHAAKFSQQLTKDFPTMFLADHPPAMNIYISPPGGNQIFPLHNDEQDVVILQISGSKVWRVQHTTDGQRYKGIKKLGTDEPNVPALRTVLLPGDLLYIPRHHKHEGFTDNDSHSISISLTNPFPGSKYDMDASKDIGDGQKNALRDFPLPQGRLGSMSLATKMKQSTAYDTLDKTKLRTPEMYLQNTLKTLIKSKSDPSHHSRSTSLRILNHLARGLQTVYNHTWKRPDSATFRISDLPASPGDSFGQMAVAVIMNWLGYAQFHF